MGTSSDFFFASFSSDHLHTSPLLQSELSLFFPSLNVDRSSPVGSRSSLGFFCHFLLPKCQNTSPVVQGTFLPSLPRICTSTALSQVLKFIFWPPLSLPPLYYSAAACSSSSDAPLGLGERALFVHTKCRLLYAMCAVGSHASFPPVLVAYAALPFFLPRSTKRFNLCHEECDMMCLSLGFACR